MQGPIAAALLVLLSLSTDLAGADRPAPPEILSLFPLGGQPGQEFSVTLRGRSLEGARALWFNSSDVSATVLSLENVETVGAEKTEEDAEAKPVQRLTARFRIDPGAAPGRRTLRVITPFGLSNPLTFGVYPEPDHREGQLPHDLASEAEPLAGYPLVVHGTIGQPAEVDYYSFEVSREERLQFEVGSLALSDMAITLYEPSGSWFSPDRARRIAFSDEPVSYPELTAEPVLRHRFEKSGRYLVRVSSFLGEGGPDHAYLLRIRRACDDSEEKGKGMPPRKSGIDPWQERTWTRELRSDRMVVLRQRTVWSPETETGADQAADDPSEGGEPQSPQEIPTMDLDGAPQESPAADFITLPALLAGAIEHPGDIDRVRFSAQVGDRIALEIETPLKTVPVFNPFLKLVDSRGAEVLTNVHSILNANTEIQKQIQPKIIHSFPRAGEFTLEIRDITAALGDESMAYRVLVRPQVPHVGQIHLAEDHLNLVAGTATPLSLVTDQEEHFDGSIALRLAGLPRGVTAVTATQAEPDAPPAVNEGRKERYVARSRKATVVVVAAADAPTTPVPVTVTVMAQPVVQGRLGRMIPVKDLLLMVVSPAKPSDRAALNSVEKAE